MTTTGERQLELDMSTWHERLEVAGMVKPESSPFLTWMLGLYELGVLDVQRLRELEALLVAAWHNGYMGGRVG